MAKEALLINRDDIMRLTSLGGNTDSDKILPHIKSAQDLHVQPILGTKLFDKLKADVLADTLEGDYETLLNTYVTPCLAHYTMVDFLAYMQYELANGGVFQHQSENSATPSRADVNSLTAQHQTQAQFYGRILNDYLCEKGSDTFAELGTNTGADIKPFAKQISNQWHI